VRNQLTVDRGACAAADPNQHRDEAKKEVVVEICGGAQWTYRTADKRQGRDLA